MANGFGREFDEPGISASAEDATRIAQRLAGRGISRPGGSRIGASAVRSLSDFRASNQPSERGTVERVEPFRSVATPSSARTETRDTGLRRDTSFDREFAREAKRIATKRGLTRVQRDALLKDAQTRFKIGKSGIEGPVAEEILGLSQASTRRGLTRVQRKSLSSAAGTLLSSAATEGDEEMSFEEKLLKDLDLLEIE